MERARPQCAHECACNGNHGSRMRKRFGRALIDNRQREIKGRTFALALARNADGTTMLPYEFKSHVEANAEASAGRPLFIFYLIKPIENFVELLFGNTDAVIANMYRNLPALLLEPYIDFVRVGRIFDGVTY